MKKSLIVLVVLGAILGGQVAHATAVDWNTQMYSGYTITQGILAKCAWDKDRNGAPSDADSTEPNGMLDWAEFAMLQAILAQPADPNHTTVHNAWDTNLALADTWANSPLAKPFVPYVAAIMTVGGPTAQAAMEAWITPTYIGIFGALPAFTQLSSILGSTGDADGDGLTNKQEYDAAVATADVTTETGATAFYAAYAAGASLTPLAPLSAVAISGPATVIEGMSATLNAAATGGTPPLTYTWTKGATTVGTGASLSLTSLAIADSGDYTVSVTDSAATPVTVTSAAHTLTVEATPMPVMGIAGAALLIGLAGALGVRKIRK